jgi:glycosyltransferase involved in cell wall biosynthesis
MKILFAIPYFYPSQAFGGPSRAAFEECKELATRGNKVVVYTSNARDFRTRVEGELAKSIDGTIVYYFRIIGWSAVRKLKLFITPELICYARRIRNFDIVHLHEYRSFQNIVLYFFAKLYKVPYIVQAHGSLPRIVSKAGPKRIFDQIIGYRILKDAAAVIALTSNEARGYQDAGVQRDKIYVVPNGINPAECKLNRKGDFRKELNIDSRTKVILFLGRLNYIKGIDVLIRAFALVKSVSSRKLALVICGPNDGYLNTIRSLICELNLEDDVLVTGPRYDDKRYEAYTDADIYVLPSRYETFPMGILEAYACGVAVIASDVGGIGELVIDRTTGILIPPNNHQKLADAITWVLNNPGHVETIRSNSRKVVEGNLNIIRTVNNLTKVYQESIGRTT